MQNVSRQQGAGSERADSLNTDLSGAARPRVGLRYLFPHVSSVTTLYATSASCRTVIALRGCYESSCGELPKIDEENVRARVALKTGDKEWFD